MQAPFSTLSNPTEFYNSFASSLQDVKQSINNIEHRQYKNTLDAFRNENTPQKTEFGKKQMRNPFFANFNYQPDILDEIKLNEMNSKNQRMKDDISVVQSNLYLNAIGQVNDGLEIPFYKRSQKQYDQPKGVFYQPKLMYNSLDMNNSIDDNRNRTDSNNNYSDKLLYNNNNSTPQNQLFINPMNNNSVQIPEQNSPTIQKNSNYSQMKPNNKNISILLNNKQNQRKFQIQTEREANLQQVPKQKKSQFDDNIENFFNSNAVKKKGYFEPMPGQEFKFVGKRHQYQSINPLLCKPFYSYTPQNNYKIKNENNLLLNRELFNRFKKDPVKKVEEYSTTSGMYGEY